MLKLLRRLKITTRDSAIATNSKTVAEYAGKASRPSPRQQNEQPRSTTKKVQVNLNKIYPVLENATRQDLINVRELWGDMLTYCPEGAATVITSRFTTGCR